MAAAIRGCEPWTGAVAVREGGLGGLRGRGGRVLVDARHVRRWMGWRRARRRERVMNGRGFHADGGRGCRDLCASRLVMCEECAGWFRAESTAGELKFERPRIV